MQILNIFVAIIIAFGFWRKNNKEYDMKTAHASFSKTFILFILSVALTFFYYKTYQVATFKNYLYVEGIKGSFYKITEYDTGEWDSLSVTPNDSIFWILIKNKFEDDNNYSYYKVNDYFTGINQQGLVTIDEPGIETHFLLYNTQTEFYPDFLKGRTLFFTSSKIGEAIIDSLRNYTHSYGISCYTNSTPNLLPFVVKSEGESNAEYKFGIKLLTKSIVTIHDNKPIGKIDAHASTLFAAENSREVDSEYFVISNMESFDKSTNKLNFFSAADLSQINYEIFIHSDIPYDNISVCFDVPIQTSSLDISKNNVTYNGFTLHTNNFDRFGENNYYSIHLALPTYANMQLIRSLILTTLLTGLLSLFIINLFFLCRKIHKKFLFKKPITFAIKRKIFLWWMPIGKIIIWSGIIFFSYIIFLSILGKTIYLRNNEINMFKIIFICCAVLYVIFLIGIGYFCYCKNIILHNIFKRIFMNLYTLLKCRCKSLKSKLRRILNPKKKLTSKQKSGICDGLEKKVEV